MNRVLIPAISLAAAGGLAFAIVKSNSANDAQRQVEEIRQKIAAEQKANAERIAKLQSDLDAERERNKFLAAERDKAKEAPVKAAETAATGDAPNQRENAIKQMMQAFGDMSKNPEMKKMMRGQQARMIGGAYEGLYKKLNLSTEDQQIVSDLLADRSSAAMEKAMKLFGGKTDEATLTATRKEIEGIKAEHDTKLRGVLGEQKFNELSSYEKTMGEQRSVDSFARSMERSGTPLEPAKKDALLTIMQEERLKIAGDGIPDIGGGGGGGAAALLSPTEAKAKEAQEAQYETNVLARATQSGFTPDQVNGLQGSLKQRREGQAMRGAMGRAFLGGALGGGGAQPPAAK
jgi:hypothetical protein